MWLNREFHRPCNCTGFSVLFPQAWQIGSTCSLLYSTIFCYILFIYWYILLVCYRYNLHIRWVFFIIAVLVAQSCLTLCDPMECSPPGSPMSMGFSRQEYWSGLPFPSPRNLPNSGVKPRSPTLKADFFYHLSHNKIYLFTASFHLLY